MYYLLEKSGKKLRELKKLYQLLKDEYKMYGASIKLQWALGIRWIDHKMNSMRQYGLYVSHLQYFIVATSTR